LPIRSAFADVVAAIKQPTIAAPYSAVLNLFCMWFP